MLDSIIHHGRISDSIEYFALAVGPELERRFFFEQTPTDDGRRVRYFGGGSEVVLTPEGLEFDGNGGIVGEYMFGGHFPLRDLLIDEVRNRLILFGGAYDPVTGELHFVPASRGGESWRELFREGNAVANYAFFVAERSKNIHFVARQEKTLRSIGKTLKRSTRVGRGNFIALAHDLHESLNEPHSTLFLIRLVHQQHQQFFEICSSAYSRNRSIAELQRIATESAEELGIDPYQRERIQIDVIYHHPQNRALIDEYKRVLGSCHGGKIGPSEAARLSRLRTLSLRNDIPLSIFDTLEDIVLQEAPTAAEISEPPYIQSSRAILESLMMDHTLDQLSSSDQVQLIVNKQIAVENRDARFEEMMLETGRLLDESMREEEDPDMERLVAFGEIATLFDRFDHTWDLVSRLALMEDVELTEEQVRSILGNMTQFESLQSGLFRELFIDPLANNPYTLSFGRRKLYALVIGLLEVENNEASLADIASSIRQINRRERAYFQLYELARRRMSTFYLELNTAEGRETFRQEIVAEFDVQPELASVIEYIEDNLIDEVITKIRLEAFYINTLLPQIIHEQDGSLRSDFLENSGLDQFQVEELETEYFEMRSLPLELLYSIRDEAS